jgi:hypothetical protein
MYQILTGAEVVDGTSLLMGITKSIRDYIYSAFSGELIHRQLVDLLSLNLMEYPTSIQTLCIRRSAASRPEKIYQKNTIN